jgi:hypothetical protein
MTLSLNQISRRIDRLTWNIEHHRALGNHRLADTLFDRRAALVRAFMLEAR